MNASMSARQVPRPAGDGSPALAAAPFAVISLGAAAIHFAVAPEHLAEGWAFGLFFAGLGWFQALWAVAYLVRPALGLRWLAIAANLATVVLWAWSRTLGLPIGPHPGMPEAVGAPDVIAGGLELALSIGLLATRAEAPMPWALPGRRDDLGDRTAASLAIASGLLVAIATTIAIAAGGG